MIPRIRSQVRLLPEIDRSLTGLAEPDYDATISFGLPFELGDSPYGESWFNALSPHWRGPEDDKDGQET